MWNMRVTHVDLMCKCVLCGITVITFPLARFTYLFKVIELQQRANKNVKLCY